MLIEHNELRIRNATKEDANILATWWNDGQVMAHAGFPNGLIITNEKIIAQLSTDSDKTRRRLIIEINDIPVGEMSYRINDEQAEIGIKICNVDYQNKGYGPKLLSMLINELFLMGCSKITLDTNINNTRARRTYEKLGFIQTKVNIDSFKDQLGNYQSSVDYELIPTNFVNIFKKDARN